jgi:IclR family transcriptional regulator, KDG regulon repressor
MVQVIIKSFDILELVAQRNGHAVSLTEISQELQLNQATAANIIKTLVSRNYLEHIGKKKGYKLGLMAYRLTNEVAYEQDLLNASREAMEELTLKVNESCLLGILRNFKRYILHNVNCNQDIQVQLRSERSVYETASGRLLVAYLSEKDRERFLQHNGLPDTIWWEEAASVSGFENALAQIREKEVAMTHFKNNHLMGFAVPVFLNNKVIASLSIFLPEYRCSASKQIEIVSSLREAAKKIELHKLFQS